MSIQYYSYVEKSLTHEFLTVFCARLIALASSCVVNRHARRNSTANSLAFCNGPFFNQPTVDQRRINRQAAPLSTDYQLLNINHGPHPKHHHCRRSRHDGKHLGLLPRHLPHCRTNIYLPPQSSRRRPRYRSRPRPRNILRRLRGRYALVRKI